MLVRGLLPDGWMPTPHAMTAQNGWAPFTICTSNGLVQLAGSPLDRAHSDKDGTGDNHFAPCPFAAAAHMASVVSFVAAIAPQAVIYHPVYFAVQVDAPHLRDVFERRRSRAPPSFVI